MGTKYLAGTMDPLKGGVLKVCSPLAGPGLWIVSRSRRLSQSLGVNDLGGMVGGVDTEYSTEYGYIQGLGGAHHLLWDPNAATTKGARTTNDVARGRVAKREEYSSRAHP
jgi:hypothetical protein